MTLDDDHMALANLLETRKNEINKTFRQLEGELKRKNLSVIHRGESLPAEEHLQAFADVYELPVGKVQAAYMTSRKARTELTLSRRSVISHRRSDR